MLKGHLGFRESTIFADDSIGGRATEAILEGKLGDEGLGLTDVRMLRPVLIDLATELNLPLLTLTKATRRVVRLAYVQDRITEDAYNETVQAIAEIEEDPE